jgi:hypothetical protein
MPGFAACEHSGRLRLPHVDRAQLDLALSDPQPAYQWHRDTIHKFQSFRTLA